MEDSRAVVCGADETRILEDIRTKTGRLFPQLASIPTKDRLIAAQVFPILRDWVYKTNRDLLREAIYACFHTTHARSYLRDLVGWWSVEQDDDASASLTQTIALLARSGDAQWIWTTYLTVGVKPFDYLLLSKLANLSSPVQTSVRDKLYEDLSSGLLAPADIRYISRVKDERIQEWLSAHSAIARAPARGKIPSLPQGLRVSISPPDRACELYSMEVDLRELPVSLEHLSSKLALELPAVFPQTGFLLDVPLNLWFTRKVSEATNTSIDLWFRLEDVDIVEIVVVRTPTTS